MSVASSVMKWLEMPIHERTVHRCTDCNTVASTADASCPACGGDLAETTIAVAPHPF